MQLIENSNGYSKENKEKIQNYVTDVERHLAWAQESQQKHQSLIDDFFNYKNQTNELIKKITLDYSQDSAKKASQIDHFNHKLEQMSSKMQLFD